MKNQWRIIVGLILTFLIVVFALLNKVNVPVSWGFSSFSAPLIVIIIGSALIGALIVTFVATGAMWQQKKEMKRMQEELTVLTNKFDHKVSEKKEELDRRYQNEIVDLKEQIRRFSEPQAEIHEETYNSFKE